MAEMALKLYSVMLEEALPIAISWEVANLIVSTFLRVAFGGRLWFGK